ncbi:MotA/TolQ/ExbB proton channel family protein [Pseudooceanicola sp. 200-1SW]|uniref:MotA/TolQ/ExbB proton channel family protein n=1 Tax=Pseudooceanicola sp. 200-1SW TaxID=3425949 RepID=UPI003D7F6A8A
MANRQARPGLILSAALAALLSAAPLAAQEGTAPAETTAPTTTAPAPAETAIPSAETPPAPGETTAAPAGTEAAPQVPGDLAPALGSPTPAAEAAPALPGSDSAPAAPAPGDSALAEAIVAPAETAGEGAPVADPAAEVATPAVETTIATPDATTPEATPTTPDAATPAPEAGLAGAWARSQQFLVNGGPAIWAIAALSVVTVALILWKIWRLVLAGAWSRRASRKAVVAWENGEAGIAMDLIEGRKGVRSRLTRAAMRARLSLSDEAAREETSRVARGLLAQQGSALRALELISTIAPLLGLLGTVMGMISAFQALQEAGSRADPSMLAGGIWEALLTTAAGMAVAIPASAALTWFEAVLDSLRADLEDLSARIFVADLPGDGMGENITKLAAQ